MLISFKRIREHILFAQGYSWVKLISITGFTQIIVQLIGFISGIIIIRLLPTDQYALYVVGNTMLGTMVVLCDGGIASGVLSQASPVWKDRDKLGMVIVTGLSLKKKMAFVSLSILTPILFYLLTINGATWYTSILIILVLIPCLIASLSTSLLSVPASLKQDIIPLQKNQLVINLGRLTLLSPLILLFPLAFIAIIPSGITQVYGNIKIRKIISDYTNLNQKPSPEIQKKLIKFIKRTLPEAIYYCFSGQLTIWILAVIGTTESVASIGALGRIAILLTVIQSIYSNLVVPRFARLENTFDLILKRFSLIQIILFTVLVLVTIIVYLFSSQILWVLGPKYNGLGNELVLVIIGSCLSMFSGLTYFTCITKTWVISPLILIPVSVVTTLIGLLLIDVSTLHGILIFNIILAAVHVIMNSSYAYYKIFKINKV